VFDRDLAAWASEAKKKLILPILRLLGPWKNIEPPSRWEEVLAICCLTTFICIFLTISHSFLDLGSPRGT
jgi:hypothetical protein